MLKFDFIYLIFFLCACICATIFLVTSFVSRFHANAYGVGGHVSKKFTFPIQNFYANRQTNEFCLKFSRISVYLPQLCSCNTISIMHCARRICEQLIRCEGGCRKASSSFATFAVTVHSPNINSHLAAVMDTMPTVLYACCFSIYA